MSINIDLIRLRILLDKNCDGFSQKSAIKVCSLSTRTKILTILADRDYTPQEMVEYLCIAKSNLVNALKPLLKDRLVVSYKNSTSSKHIHYRITDLGIQELNTYKNNMYTEFKKNLNKTTDNGYNSNIENNLSQKIEDIIKILEGDK